MLTAPFGKCSSPSCLTTAVIRSNAAGDAVMPCFAHRAFRSHSPSPSSSSLAAATVWMVCDPLSSFWSATSLMRSASFICAGSGGSTSFEEDALYGRTLAAGADDISFSLGSFSFSLTLLTLTFSAAATRAGTGCAPSPRSRHVCARWAPWQARHSPFALDVRPIERSLTERESGFAYVCRVSKREWELVRFTVQLSVTARGESCRRRSTFGSERPPPSALRPHASTKFATWCLVEKVDRRKVLLGRDDADSAGGHRASSEARAASTFTVAGRRSAAHVVALADGDTPQPRCCRRAAADGLRC